MKPSIMVSSGDVNGIGLECFVKALSLGIPDCSLTLAVNTDTLRHYVLKADVNAVIENNMMLVGDVNVQLINIEHRPEIEFGIVSKLSGLHSLESLRVAIAEVKARRADGILTLPISKEACILAGWQHQGQTEMLGDADGNQAMMILCHHQTRVALATGHMPISAVPNLITRGMLNSMLQRFANTLHKDFTISVPRIAVLGLNPHAGENGHIGTEDTEIIGATLSSLNLSSENHPSTHWIFEGPFPADGFFAFDTYRHYDGIVAMYHDQGLIPLKLLSHGSGINFTAGLSFIRTSPDHGTAFSIAGKSQAQPASTLQALKLAVEVYHARTGGA